MFSEPKVEFFASFQEEIFHTGKKGKERKRNKRQ
jgi:hypothetical protein